VSARARSSAALVCAFLSLGGCYVREAEPGDARARSSGEPVQFTFGTLQGEELSSDTTRGRTTALLFVTTYDLPSQAVAQMLRDVLATHKPRANGAVVMMEPPRAAELAQVWARSLRMTLPIAMATPSLMAGESQLGRIQGVPTLLVLDRTGRVVARLEGAHTREELAEALARADLR
jgi:hypothetical protein